MPQKGKPSFSKMQTAGEKPAPAPLYRDVEKPILTLLIATMLAKLIHIGCPPLDAVRYLAPTLDVDSLKALSREWMASELVLQAVEELNGGPWIDLPPNDRYQLALDKTIAEVAYYLWVNNFNDTEHKEGLAKFDMARQILKAELKGTTDDADPTQAFARFALDLLKYQSEQASKAATEPKAGSGDKMLKKAASASVMITDRPTEH